MACWACLHPTNCESQTARPLYVHAMVVSNHELPAADSLLWLPQLSFGLQTPPGDYVVQLADPLELTCSAWLVANATGDILAGSDIDARLQPASLTKIATALVVLRAVQRGLARLDDLVRVSETAAACKAGTHAHLSSGELYSVRDMLYALMLPSGNDAAVALAEHFGARTSVLGWLCRCVACPRLTLPFVGCRLRARHHGGRVPKRRLLRRRLVC